MSLTEDISFDNRGEAVKFPLFRKLFLALVIILVALLSFGIGRLSVTGKEPIRIEYDPELTTNNSQPTTSQTASVITAIKGGGVVASKNGTKYHYSHCAGAKQIKEENKISFNSPQEAEGAGYSLAANCSAR